MNRVSLVLRAADVRLQRFDHPDGTHHHDHGEEVASSASINFVDDGAFAVRVGRVTSRIAPGTLFVAERGMAFSCSHDSECPTDRCLSLGYDERAVEDLLAAGVPALRPPAFAVSARQRFIRARLERCDAGDALRFELLAGALFESLGAAAAPATEVKAAHLAWRIDRAIELVDAHFERPLSLRDLASAAGLSPFHFARAFKSLVGIPPHRYLTAVRLRHAAHRIEQGASVTETCYDVGFVSPSHFATAFRERFGVTADAVKRGARCAGMRAWVVKK